MTPQMQALVAAPHPQPMNIRLPRTRSGSHSNSRQQVLQTTQRSEGSLQFPRVLTSAKPTLASKRESGRTDSNRSRSRSAPHNRSRSVSQGKESKRDSAQAAIAYVWGSDKCGQLGQNSQKRLF